MPKMNAKMNDRMNNTVSALRTKAGLTQESLAERADMHHNLIGEVERVGAGSVEHNCRLAIDNSQQSLIANGVRVRREGRCRARGDAEGEPQLEG